MSAKSKSGVFIGTPCSYSLTAIFEQEGTFFMKGDIIEGGHKVGNYRGQGGHCKPYMEGVCKFNPCSQLN